MSDVLESPGLDSRTHTVVEGFSPPPADLLHESGVDQTEADDDIDEMSLE